MDGLIARLRVLVRIAVPVLRREGWEEPDLRCISPAIQAAIAAQDEPVLRLWCDWLSGKLPGCVEAGTGVQPVLSDAAESRLADLWWKRGKG